MTVRTRFLWLSDPHFVADGTVLGHDTRLRLRRAIEMINTQYTAAAFVLISGDMVNRGTEEDYAALAEVLKELAIPYLPLPGNHDDRALFRKHLRLPDVKMETFIQYEVRVGGARVIGLDTLKSGADSGELCAVRRDWLRSRLSIGEAPALIFMHHPPMALGLPMQDPSRLEDDAGFLDLIAESGCVAFLGAGHVHRPTMGAVRGIPFATMGALAYQAPPPDPAWDWESFAPAAEAPRLGVVTVDGSDVTVATVQICPYEDGGA